MRALDSSPILLQQSRPRRSSDISASAAPEQIPAESKALGKHICFMVWDWHVFQIDGGEKFFFFPLLKLLACEQTFCHTHPQTACPCVSC